MTRPQLSFTEKLFVRLQHVLPRVALSRAMGCLGDSEIAWIKNALIGYFCYRFPINLEEAEYSDPRAYRSFNAFFTRALKPEARTITPDTSALLSPCDGTFLVQNQWGVAQNQAAPGDDSASVQNSPTLQVKGHHFTLDSLLAAQSHLVERFQHGHASIIYLAPHNYHRVHMPCDGQLVNMIHVPGTLYSVNDTTVKGVPGVFARNERVICTFETDHGLVAVILVGALIVGSIATPWAGIVSPKSRRVTTSYYPPLEAAQAQTIQLKQGEEMGRFLMGSTVIVLTERDTLTWSQSVNAGTPVTLGSPLAQWTA